jgi:hypothetical protein
VDKSQIENIAAALSELEAEKQRRIDEKVEKGEAVRVPALSIVVGGPRRSVPPSRTSWPHCERPARRARFISRSRR